MAIIKTIPWDDGSGDNIYLDSNASEGNQTVTVSSDANTGAARTKIITFSTDIGNESETLTITQPGGTLYTVTFVPSFYDENNYSYYSINNLTRAYASSTSTTACTINLARGDNAETWVYWGFDTSSIPVGAHIESVSCVIKSRASTGNSNAISSRKVGLYCGTTLKGDEKTMSTTATQVTLNSSESWTYEEAQNIRVRTYAKRKNLNTSTNYNIEMYGATLTVTYII